MLLQPARLDSGKLKQLYRLMLQSRLLAQKLDSAYQEGKVDRMLVPEAGQEAILAGALADLEDNDRIACGCQGALARLCSGDAVNTILFELLGFNATAAGNHALGRAIPPTIAVSDQIKMAVGAAWAFKTIGGRSVAVSIVSGKAIRAEALPCALAFSARLKLPVIYVLRTSSGERHPIADAADVSPDTLPRLVLDGDDVLAVYRVTQEAIRRARQGRGPALVECQTTFAGASALEVVTNQHEDPIARIESHLQQRGLWSEGFRSRLLEAFDRELKQALAAAQRARPRRGADARRRPMLVSTG